MPTPCEVMMVYTIMVLGVLLVAALTHLIDR